MSTLVVIAATKMQVLNIHCNPVHVIISNDTHACKFDLKYREENKLPSSLEDVVSMFISDNKLDKHLSYALNREGKIKFSKTDGCWGYDLELIYIKEG